MPTNSGIGHGSFLCTADLGVCYMRGGTRTCRGRKQKRMEAKRQIEIRRAQESDLGELVPLFDAYRSFFAGEKPSGSRAFLAERLRENDAIFFLACSNSQIAGFLTLYPLFSSWHAARIWFLSDLYVREESRNAGIGRRLVEAAQAFARDNGSRSIMVEIPHSEPHLVQFYERLQFIRDRNFDLHRYYIA